MREKIHPTWYPEATVICACGNTWTTGSTVPEIRTDVCSACHPFYTGEQRIVDTEGQVDRFMARLRARDQYTAELEARESARTSPDVPVAEIGLEKRYVNGGVGLCNAYSLAKVSDRLRRISSSPDTCDGRHSRVIPAFDLALVYESLEVSL